MRQQRESCDEARERVIGRGKRESHVMRQQRESCDEARERVM